MGVEWLFWPFGILFLIAFSLVVGSRLGTKRIIFIFLIATLFVLVGNFGGDIVVNHVVNPAAGTASYYAQTSDTYKSGVLLFFGVIGLALMTFFRQERTEDIGYALGIGGTLQALVGMIGLALNQGNEVKFVIALVALIIISWLFYKYRDSIIGEQSYYRPSQKVK